MEGCEVKELSVFLGAEVDSYRKNKEQNKEVNKGKTGGASVIMDSTGSRSVDKSKR